MAIVINDIGEAESFGIVEDGGSNNRHIDAPESIAIIHQRFIAKGRNREAFLLVARDDKCEQ